MGHEKSALVGVKIIAILHYISAVLSVIGLLLVFGLGWAFVNNTLLNETPITGGAIIILLGIVFIVFAVLGFFVGRGLWNGKKWSRIVAIIISILGVLSSFNLFINKQFFLGAWSILVGGAITVYLLFNKKVKKFFG